jgi:CRP-like cAMP-binding protein
LTGSGTDTGYAADDALVCLCPTGTLGAAVDAGARTAREVVALHRSALDRVERFADARGRGTALGRVATALCAVADTLSPPRKLDTIPGALRQRDLADLLGLRSETVCRALRALEWRGAVRRDEGGTHIVDRRVLEVAE